MGHGPGNMPAMDTRTSELSAARTELQTHLANVEQKLFAVRTAQAIRTAMDRADARMAVNIDRLEEQREALRGILDLICDRLGQLELSGVMQRPA